MSKYITRTDEVFGITISAVTMVTQVPVTIVTDRQLSITDPPL